MATPSKQRHQDVIASLPRLPRARVAGMVVSQLDEVPPSSASKITDSAERARNSSALASDYSRRKHESVLPAIEQTPSRGPSKLWGRPPTSASSPISKEDVSMHCPDTAKPKPPKATIVLSQHPSKLWSSNTHGTPSKARTDESNECTVQKTPDKAICCTEILAKVWPAVAPTSLRGQEESIYASLGWDDDFDELS